VDTLAAMRRLIALILLLLFPLQAVQAANTGLYEHLQGTHHHQHDAPPAASPYDSLQSSGTVASASPRTIHADCNVCHLVHAPGLLTATVTELPVAASATNSLLPSITPPGSASGGRPERPKWQRFA